MARAPPWTSATRRASVRPRPTPRGARPAPGVRAGGRAGVDAIERLEHPLAARAGAMPAPSSVTAERDAVRLRESRRA